MRPLIVVFLLKIGVTLALWTAPLLLLSEAWLVHIGFPIREPHMPLVRLLGAAYGALLVNYLFGLRCTLQNRYPREVVWTGIASNGGAFIVLCVYAAIGGWSTWGVAAQVIMWVSLVATGLIAFGLIAFGRPTGTSLVEPT